MSTRFLLAFYGFFVALVLLGAAAAGFLAVLGSAASPAGLRPFLNAAPFLGVASAIVLIIAHHPWYVWFRDQYRQPAALDVRSVDVDDPETPAEFASAVRSASQAWAALGYGPTTALHLVTREHEALTALAAHPRTGTVASVVFSSNDFRILGHMTRHAGGGGLATMNLSETSFLQWPFASWPGWSSLAVFEVDGPAPLARLHEARLEAAGRGDAALIAAPFDPVAYSHALFDEAMKVQVRAGYMVLDGDDYRLTRLGAWKVAFKCNIPIALLRVALARRRAERALRAFRA
ncbi:hypothetical protein [Paludisphaera mucosa]|uniref:Uncharacterized protein n=1 Tax=Paludisphaera mucosa TaxID=3030827 RepID=A0ABT6FHX2_9BACT|nr:hypothetical protein [Paludisphaera mucosa]MDG3007144.1 hypothetical protein [Paludisphaera mucosa]